MRRQADPAPLSEQEKEESYLCYDTEDFHIGYNSFLEKTKPEFKGK
jgi:hypothetical protein